MTGELGNKIDSLWEIFWNIRGDVYEYLLSKITQSGVNGQFRTSRHIIRMMVEMMDPKPTDSICENCTTSLIRVVAA